MRFGPCALDHAMGAVLAHSVGLPGDGRLRKGVVLETEHIARLRAAGLTEVVVARPDPDDIEENRAAELLAKALVPDPGAVGLSLAAPFTGRVNVLSTGPGVLRLDRARIDAANAVDPMITVATLPDLAQVHQGAMVATVKIISYAVPSQAVEVACSALNPGAMRRLGNVHGAVTLIVTDTDGGPGTKGAQAISARVEALGMTMAQQEVVPHEQALLSAAILAAQGDLILILTASATSDPHDTAPEALREAGGVVERFGMPVDPGNLLFLGARADGVPVIGLPGCARSPALNGADWVLSRIACGVPVTAADIAGMGVGGLLKEIPSRGMPRKGR